VPGQPGGPAKKGNPLLIVLIAVVAVLLIGGGSLAIGLTRSSPQKTVKAFIAATNDKDCNALKDLMTDPSLVSDCDLTDQGTYKTSTITTHKSGKTATVTVYGTYKGSPDTLHFTLQKVGSTWKISDLSED